MPIFLQFQVKVERLLNHKIISVQSDQGGEYRNLHTYFQSVGITHRLSCPHTHQQQGCVVNTDSLLIPHWHCLLTAIFPKNIGMKLVYIMLSHKSNVNSSVTKSISL
jgi:hypothetical protein